MSEPDWTDVKSVRAWLDERYPIANKETGSPFFQYLKDELAKGNKIRRRENHLSRDEFLRWVWDANTGPDGPRAFHYSGNEMRIPYYPEYVDDEHSQSSGSQSPATQTGDSMARLENSTMSRSNRRFLVNHHERSKPSRERARTNSRNKQLPQKNHIVKKNALTASNDDITTEKSGSKAPPKLSTSKATTSITKDGQKIEKEALGRPKARAATLRPRNHCKRGESEFFHPDKTRRRGPKPS